jgi:hypothetical protein
VDTADLGGGDNDGVGLLGGVEGGDGGGVLEVELAAGAEDKRDAGLGGEAAHEGGADHALVSGDMDFHGKKERVVGGE